MSRISYTTSSGDRLRLDAEIGRGGEGTVFSIADSPNCAKIYHQPLSRDRAEKIRLMAANRNATLSRFSSWPVDLIRTSAGQPIGLVMPKLTGMKDVHELYSPKSRRDKFPRADWRFLVRTSCNIARAFAALHSDGLVIGDVNHGSILVGQDARVSLVDTDSFQMVFAGKMYLCEKGVETYTPPELQAKSFSGIARSPDHDNFGLAILIFHLLMMGRHPFAGRFSGVGEMPIPRAISERRFAYSANKTTFQMDRPPGTPDLSILGSKIPALFETAFTTPQSNRRPTAQTWIDSLAELEKALVQCRIAQAHWYFRSGDGCPWCRMERATGTPLFSFVVQDGGSSLDVPALVKRISELSNLGLAPTIMLPDVPPSPEVLEAFQERRKLQGTSVFLGCVLSVIGFIFGSVFFALAGAGAALGLYKIIVMSDRSKAKYRQAAEQARSAWAKDHDQWKHQASGKSFDDLKSSFFAAKAEWDRLPQLRIQRLNQLQKDRYRLQLEQYLDGFAIDAASISGIGPGRKVTLASEGIETAADVVEGKLFIPGFGPATRSRLLDWRKSLERGFVFDAAKPVDPRHVAMVEQGIVVERKRLETKLKEKADFVVQEHERVQFVRRQLQPRTEASAAALAQAEVNLKTSP